MPLILSNGSGALAARETVQTLLACNAETARFGLCLSGEDAAELAEGHSRALQNTGRIELGPGIQPKLIKAFCDSPYVSAQNYAETLDALTELFYAAKNETLGRITDDDLIAYMKEAFDGMCQGSIELLCGRWLEDFAARVRAGETIEPPHGGHAHLAGADAAPETQEPWAWEKRDAGGTADGTVRQNAAKRRAILLTPETKSTKSSAQGGAPKKSRENALCQPENAPVQAEKITKRGAPQKAYLAAAGAKIDAATLDGADYAVSLMHRGVALGLVSEAEHANFQAQALGLLAEIAQKYNGCDSDSMPAETAQSLLDSLLFTVGVRLKAEPSPDAALICLRTKPLSGLYAEGRLRVAAMLDEAKATHAVLISTLCRVPNVFYCGTLKDGITGFFKLYDPVYAAQKIHITADYQLYVPLPRLAGIEFIRRYLAGASCENEFCRLFPARAVNRLLYGITPEYPTLMFNIYEPVLAAALGCMLAGNDAAPLKPTPEGLMRIEAAFPAGQTPEKTLNVLQQAAAALKTEFAFSPALETYIAASLPLLACRIGPAAKGHALGRIFGMPDKA